MKFKMSIIPFLLLFVLSSPCFCEEKEIISLSLEDCVEKALRNNLSVAVESYNPELAEYTLKRAREVFMPRLDITYGSQENQNPPYWWLEGVGIVKSKYSNYKTSLVQQIFTGGNLSLSLSGYKSDTNQSFQLLNPRFGSTLQFDFVQPLLKNFGPQVSRKEIIIAQNNWDISFHNLKAVLLDTVYSVQEAYWNLVYATESLKVKEYSLKLARDLLEKSKKEVEFGKLAPIEVLNAEAEVASREADILQAESLIKSTEDVLKTMLNLEKEGISFGRIVPVDKPEFVKKEVSLEEALKTAARKRPDLMITKTDLESKELRLKVAKNQILPELNLQVSYWSPGISGDRLVYENDNPFTGNIIDKEKGSATDSLRDAFKLLYNNWSVGVTLSLPLSSFLTKAEYGLAQVELNQSLVKLKNLEQQIFLEVRNAVLDIETNAKRVKAYSIAKELAEKRLAAEEKKLSMGLTTNYFVLQYQEKLENARSLELKALMDYNLSWAKLEKALGTSLENRNIKFSEFQ